MPLELELGMDIIDLVDPKRHGDLLERVKALRRTIAQELGIVIPPVHARDNERLQPTHYAFRVHGVQVAEGEAPQRFLLAVGKGLERIEGEPTRDPAYGGAAKWIPNEMRYRATVAGATVVERSAVVTTHLSEVVRRHAGELLSRQDVRLLLDTVKAENPVVLEEMTAAGLTLGSVQGVLRGLLEEGVPVKDLVRIIEAITDQAATASKDPDSLLEAARIALAPQIAAMFAKNGTAEVITLEPTLEQSLAASLQLSERGRQLGNSSEELEHLVSSLASRRERGGGGRKAARARLLFEGTPGDTPAHQGPPAPHGGRRRPGDLLERPNQHDRSGAPCPGRCALRQRRWRRPGKGPASASAPTCPSWPSCATAGSSPVGSSASSKGSAS